MSLIKLALLLNILYLKNPTEYEDILMDLIDLMTKLQSSQINSEFFQVYSDLMLSLITKAVSSFSDFINKTFKKVSKHFTKESVFVFADFIKNDLKSEDLMEQDIIS